MAIEVIMLLSIIGGALCLFLFSKLSVDLTALIVSISLMLTGILTPEEGVSGFSNMATLTVLALLILSEGLKNTGAVDLLGDLLIKLTGYSEWVTLLIIMVVSSVLSAFINTTAVVAVFIPVMFRIARKQGLSVSLLLIPLSFAAMIGGSSTMIGTSTNLLINSISQSYGLEKFRIFDLSLLGVVLLVILILYMLLIGRRMLAKKIKTIELFDEKLDSHGYVTEFIINDDSPLIEKSLDDITLSDKNDFLILRVIRGVSSLSPLQIDNLLAGDILVVKTNLKEIVNLTEQGMHVRSNRSQNIKLNDPSHSLFEALITPSSNLTDQKIKDVNFSRFYEAQPLGIRKGGGLGNHHFMNHTLKVGDILLMDGEAPTETYNSRHDWVIIQRIAKEKIKTQLYKRDKMVISVLILAAVIGLAVSGAFPILVSAWTGVVAMILTGCITLKKAYQNVEWKVVFLLAGIIPLGLALEKTGTDELIAQGITNFIGDYGPQFIISSLFLITMIFTSIISNQAAAILLVPIAIKVAIAVQMPPEAAVIAVLFASNTSFLTPVGYQTNVMVYGTGSYTFGDFFKVGGLLCLIIWVVVSWLIPVFYM